MGRAAKTKNDPLGSGRLPGSPGQIPLFHFDDPPVRRSRVTIGPIRHPIWTENKAKLIERYLYYFVLITKHGTYIDGFAGPQEPDLADAWSARLVLESEPKWLRRFFLCDADAKQFEALEQLRQQQPPTPKGLPKRTVQLYSGDFNVVVDEILSSGLIKEKEAAFCLLDQRTFECQWSTLESLARHKKTGPRIELFYFLCAQWFGRAFHATRDEGVLARWWGRDDWRLLGAMNDRQRSNAVCKRMEEDLGYKSALAWPIFSKADGGRIAYHMIHASDHDEAPKLMYRAYRRAVMPKETPEQLGFEWTSTDSMKVPAEAAALPKPSV